MLKFLLACVMLMPLVNSWWAVQSSLFVLSFIMIIYCHHDFGNYMMGWCFNLDSLGYILILLSFWITSLVVCSSQKVLKDNNYPSLFLVVNIFLLFFLVMTFSVNDYLLFYISFESSLIPTLILILGWGYQPERLQAGVYMLFYTLFASLPLLVSLISLYNMSGSLTLGLVESVKGVGFIPCVWYVVTVFAFIVKLPMFLVHLWLPKAHVEAPVAGSMILAGVLLKLGGYGLIRVLPLFSEVNKSLSWLWVSISLVGGVVVSLMCLRQVDMKALIAYSSVAHMGLVLSGLVVFGWWGLNGAVVVMIGHGLCSSGLFCLANMVYERVGSRSLLISKGLINFMPSMALWWFLLSAGNMAAPPTLNLLGEISLIISVVSWSKVTMLSIALLSFFSAAYTLYMFSLSQHGKYYSSLFSCCSGKVREYLILMLHWLPLNVLILKSSTIMCIL
ncbi:NADH dehydrogenase subunit 4 (mitochondrion) [Penaeus chinensis]|uniref:NADH-ubiquinone oxidoreductase chain 4 n=1 Tax=Penaeus chinensis TaxID=139456 RepID=A7IYK1_PENCE|nr:NADH dehydrogenase subunit 4 [Penaeus chinensis]ABF83977.1 NADH dehydrogenase subunit 4 [Penaeus chinensis]ABG65673.1 NADH dehydrogenase subunit 4 [Penaeus chinensis]